MPKDIQYKNGLRKDLLSNELITEFIEKEETQKALDFLKNQIGRIKSSLWN